MQLADHGDDHRGGADAVGDQLVEPGTATAAFGLDGRHLADQFRQVFMAATEREAVPPGLPAYADVPASLSALLVVAQAPAGQDCGSASGL